MLLSYCAKYHYDIDSYRAFSFASLCPLLSWFSLFKLKLNLWAESSKCFCMNLFKKLSGSCAYRICGSLVSCVCMRSHSFSLLKKILCIYLSASGLSCRMQGLLVAAFELLVATCGIQFPDQGSNRGRLHWELRVLATGLPGKAQRSLFSWSTLLFSCIPKSHINAFSLIGDHSDCFNANLFLCMWITATCIANSCACIHIFKLY